MTINSKKQDATAPFEADELLALARLDIERGALEEALRKLKQLTALKEPLADAFSLTGRLYAQLGLWDRAKREFQRYLEKEPNAVTEAFELGMVNFDAGHREEAKRIWDGLLQKHALHPPALFYRALLSADQGEATEAKQRLELLLKSVAADNLYFGRAKELMQAIESRQGRAAADRDNNFAELRQPRAKDPYKTEH